ncbi:hypothetical protein H696_05604 [Fonticula alba]|uniref:GT23 domain-containing protein n=1 Tax=Fonticula alba TaxID=691883 RepID=A0A058Z0T5_FONAL|nr:hypothetical protein H696_05604 [Fonticula alba]KCV67874.1 hypothetical protein H696_05604 [Fonticula alba]|eukprot:XP_009497694.1 hypothetical protein H696_05604 [Fonticula alba]
MKRHLRLRAAISAIFLLGILVGLSIGPVLPGWRHADDRRTARPPRAEAMAGRGPEAGAVADPVSPAPGPGATAGRQAEGTVARLLQLYRALGDREQVIRAEQRRAFAEQASRPGIGPFRPPAGDAPATLADRVADLLPGGPDHQDDLGFFYYAQRKVDQIVWEDPGLRSARATSRRRALGTLLSRLGTLQFVDPGPIFRQLERDLALPGGTLSPERAGLARPLDGVPCEQRPLLLCSLDKDCGFGCVAHHLVTCLAAALHLERTLVIRPRSIRYRGRADRGWYEFFQRIGDCEALYDPHAPYYRHGRPNGEQVLQFPIIDSFVEVPDFLPPALPGYLWDAAAGFHSTPGRWYVGMLAWFLMRPTPAFAEQLASYAYGAGLPGEPATGGDRPYVGIHIRRSDKIGVEAQLYPTEEYVRVARGWFADHYPEQVALLLVVTDDPAAARDCLSGRMGRPLAVVTDPAAAQLAGDLAERYGPAAFEAVVRDILLLARAGHLVCTFSSQVCRLAYELKLAMDSLDPAGGWSAGSSPGGPGQRCAIGRGARHRRLAWDSSHAAESLDEPWYFGGAAPRPGRLEDLCVVPPSVPVSARLNEHFHRQLAMDPAAGPQGADAAANEEPPQALEQHGKCRHRGLRRPDDEANMPASAADGEDRADPPPDPVDVGAAGPSSPATTTTTTTARPRDEGIRQFCGAVPGRGFLLAGTPLTVLSDLENYALGWKTCLVVPAAARPGRGRADRVERLNVPHYLVLGM